MLAAAVKISPVTKKSGRKTNKDGRKTRSAGLALASGLTRTSRIDFGGVAELFAGRAVVSLLRTFFLNPSRDYYQRELTEVTGERLFLVQTALKKLTRAGLVSQVSRGNRTYYRVDPTHPAYEELRALIVKTIGIGDTLRARLLELGEKVRAAFIYGSVARGDETPTSDVDIMLVGTLSGREIATILAPVKRLMNREINASVYSPAEIRVKYRQRHPFIRDVIDGPKVFLVGDADVLDSAIGRRSA